MKIRIKKSELEKVILEEIENILLEAPEHVKTPGGILIPRDLNDDLEAEEIKRRAQEMRAQADDAIRKRAQEIRDMDPVNLGAKNPKTGEYLISDEELIRRNAGAQARKVPIGSDEAADAARQLEMDKFKVEKEALEGLGSKTSKLRRLAKFIRGIPFLGKLAIVYTLYSLIDMALAHASDAIEHAGTPKGADAVNKLNAVCLEIQKELFFLIPYIGDAAAVVDLWVDEFGDTEPCDWDDDCGVGRDNRYKALGYGGPDASGGTGGTPVDFKVGAAH